MRLRTYKFNIILTRGFKRKTEAMQFSSIRLRFAHRANGSLSFIRLLRKKQVEVIRLQTD
jgi:hypothetical protein